MIMLKMNIHGIQWRVNKMKNRIVLYILTQEGQQRKELVNFNKVDRTWMNGELLIRIQCDNAFYYFPVQTTIIAEVNICD